MTRVGTVFMTAPMQTGKELVTHQKPVFLSHLVFLTRSLILRTLSVNFVFTVLPFEGSERSQWGNERTIAEDRGLSPLQY